MQLDQCNQNMQINRVACHRHHCNWILMHNRVIIMRSCCHRQARLAHRIVNWDAQPTIHTQRCPFTHQHHNILSTPMQIIHTLLINHSICDQSTGKSLSFSLPDLSAVNSSPDWMNFYNFIFMNSEHPNRAIKPKFRHHMSPFMSR